MLSWQVSLPFSLLEDLPQPLLLALDISCILHAWIGMLIFQTRIFHPVSGQVISSTRRHLNRSYLNSPAIYGWRQWPKISAESLRWHHANHSVLGGEQSRVPNLCPHPQLANINSKYTQAERRMGWPTINGARGVWQSAAANVSPAKSRTERSRSEPSGAEPRYPSRVRTVELAPSSSPLCFGSWRCWWQRQRSQRQPQRPSSVAVLRRIHSDMILVYSASVRRLAPTDHDTIMWRHFVTSNQRDLK